MTFKQVLMVVSSVKSFCLFSLTELSPSLLSKYGGIAVAHVGENDHFAAFISPAGGMEDAAVHGASSDI